VTAGGALLLFILAVLTEWATQKPLHAAATAIAQRNAIGEACRRNAGAVAAMGMQHAMQARWEAAHEHSVEQQRRGGDAAATLGAIAKVARFSLQSLVLAAGAWLILRQELTAGAMFACSMIAARALAPIELAVTQWRGFVGARQSFGRLKEQLRPAPPAAPLVLPLPRESLSVEALAVAPPGAARPTLLQASFALKAGDGLAIIGPSACGKSTLVRAVAGVWQPAHGAVRLDGATLGQWPAGGLGPAIGYLPQEIELFDGSIADNIARFSATRDDAAVIAAAREAGIHEMIVRMPLGYETPIGDGGAGLSGGQRQRIALARALYGEPFLVILDEPNANLDSAGEAALLRAIQAVRQRGGIVIIVAHRSSILSGVNLVLALADGRQQAFGPRDEVLRRQAQPAANVTSLKAYGEAHV
jgi:ATP-binding cassette subfamily C protein